MDTSILKFVHDSINTDAPVRMVMGRATIDITQPTDKIDSYKTGDTLYILIAVGPEDKKREEILQSIMTTEMTDTWLATFFEWWKKR
jgi:hypothetical protein